MVSGLTLLHNMIGKTVYEYEGFGFKFGMYASAVSEKASGTSISGLIKRMGIEGEATSAILQYFYGAAVAYEHWKKSGKEVDISDVADMLEKMGDAESVRVFNESLGVPKNSEAPKQTGQTLE
jgi:hypothetical protein